MPAEFWVAIAGQLIVVIGALLLFERRLATAVADIEWLKAYAQQRREHHPAEARTP